MPCGSSPGSEYSAFVMETLFGAMEAENYSENRGHRVSSGKLNWVIIEAQQREQSSMFISWSILLSGRRRRRPRTSFFSMELNWDINKSQEGGSCYQSHRATIIICQREKINCGILMGQINIQLSEDFIASGG